MIDSRIRKGEIVRLAAVVAPNGFLTGWTFVECRIDGPAVVATPDCEIVDCVLGEDPDAYLWPIDATAHPAPAGLVILSRCVFERCEFVNVGFAAPAEVIELWRVELQRQRSAQQP